MALLADEKDVDIPPHECLGRESGGWVYIYIGLVYDPTSRQDVYT